MAREIYQPQCKIYVRFQYTSERTFSFIDQTILHLLQENYPLSKIPTLLGLPRRVVAESTFDLMTENLLTVNASSVKLSPHGEEWCSKLTKYRKYSMHGGNASVYYQWNTGHTSVDLNLEDDFDDYGEKKIAPNDSDTAKAVHFSQLDDNENAKIFYADEYITPNDWRNHAKRLDRNFSAKQNYVEMAVKNAVKNALEQHGYMLFSIDPIEKPPKCYEYVCLATSHDSSAPELAGSQSVPVVHMPEESWLLSAKDHDTWLSKALSAARTHILIFSAHHTAAAIASINEKLNPKCENALLVLGYYDEKAQQNMRQSQIRCALIADQYSNSDLKMVIYDDHEGQVHLALGSYNWMQNAAAAPSDKKGMEISLVLNSTAHASTICDILEYLHKSVEGYANRYAINKLQYAMSKLRSITRAPRSRDVGEKSHEPQSMFAAGTMLTNQCGNALRSAQKRCLVLSHTMRTEMPIMKVLSNREATFEEGCIVAFSKMYEPDTRDVKASDSYIEDYIQESLKGISQADAITIAQIKNLHARLVINDDTITISSLNFLSSTGAVRQSLGLLFKDAQSATWLMGLFAAWKKNKEAAETTAHADEREQEKVLETLRNMNPAERDELLRLASEKTGKK